MKHLKRFIILAVVLGIGSLLLMRTPATQFRGQDSLELTRHYNSIKAEDINRRAIELILMTRNLREMTVTRSGCRTIWH